ncbi:MAG: Asp-tRNA(Asn)/Glu-tRNA(Gln) amidotransferase subunit GatC [Elusimicrobiota bacterium]|jgi:aspartyl-tRNA(Asn)/glutamyl-tRNA(Gln) amidotransferase subunit C
MITEEDVLKAAALARLALEPGEAARRASELERILAHVDALRSLDLSRVEPTAHALELEDVFRADDPKPSGLSEELLAAAPERDGPYFKVPKVIE